LLRTLRQLETDWEVMSQRASAVNRPRSINFCSIFSDCDPTSVEYHQRYAQPSTPFAHACVCWAPRNAAVLDTAQWQNDARRCCDSWGRRPDGSRLLAHFYGAQQRLQARSSTIACHRAGSGSRIHRRRRNYLRWLIDTARVCSVRCGPSMAS
jgi:hypothetical protein